jgi:hypothetical protein
VQPALGCQIPQSQSPNRGLRIPLQSRPRYQAKPAQLSGFQRYQLEPMLGLPTVGTSWRQMRRRRAILHSGLSAAAPFLVLARCYCLGDDHGEADGVIDAASLPEHTQGLARRATQRSRCGCGASCGACTRFSALQSQMLTALKPGMRATTVSGVRIPPFRRVLCRLRPPKCVGIGASLARAASQWSVPKLAHVSGAAGHARSSHASESARGHLWKVLILVRSDRLLDCCLGVRSGSQSGSQRRR